MDDVIVAFVIGIVWAVVLVLYGKFSNTGLVPDYEGTIRSAVRIGTDIAFVGGGTGVVVYLLDSYFSALRYGLAGIVCVLVAVTIVAKLR